MDRFLMLAALKKISGYSSLVVVIVPHFAEPFAGFAAHKLRDTAVRVVFEQRRCAVEQYLRVRRETGGIISEVYQVQSTVSRGV